MDSYYLFNDTAWDRAMVSVEMENMRHLLAEGVVNRLGDLLFFFPLYISWVCR